MPKEGYKSVTVSDEMYEFISQMQQLLDVRGRAEVLDTLLSDKKKQYGPFLNQLNELKKNSGLNKNDLSKIETAKRNVAGGIEPHNIIELKLITQSLLTNHIVQPRSKQAGIVPIKNKLNKAEELADRQFNLAAFAHGGPTAMVEALK